MAFHSYTQLIQKLFNAYWCGPPYRVTGTSPWPSVDHSVSRLPPPTVRPVQARFHCGSARHRAPPRRRRQLVGSLCKRHAVTPEGAPTACGRTVSGTISLPWKGCFSPFPHGTRSLSVSREYLALPDGPGDANGPRRASRTGLSPSTVGLSRRVPLTPRVPPHGPTTPGARKKHAPRFGLFPGRSPLLGESLLFSFPAGTKMFQFPALASAQESADGRPSACRVVPFGYPRIKGHLHLPAAYRSLSRPSSPP